MTILIEDKTALLPVLKYGGTERVIWGLGKELSKMGHKVYFLVKKGSSCDFAKVIEYNLEKSLEEQIPNDVDVVHLFNTVDKTAGKPRIYTTEGNPAPNLILDINTVFVSKNHAYRYGSDCFVYNGIDWSEYPKPDLNLNRSYVHFLAKASWKIKNLFGAIKIALKSGNKIQIMGGDRWTYANLKRGFKYLFSPKITFHGMVDNNKKMEIANKSNALLFPVKWHEPFGIAITESLYAGCAVFGSKNGSLDELIKPEIGFSSNNSEDLISAIKNFNYNPKRCHEHALKYYNSEIMAKEYLKLYTKVIKGEDLNKERPKYIPERNIVPEFI